MGKLAMLVLIVLCIAANISLYADNKIVTIDVLPDKVNLKPGETYRFIARGYNRYYEEVRFTPAWSATGGQVTSDGVYTAGSSAGVHSVMAVNRSTGAQGSAVVIIKGLHNQSVSIPASVKITHLVITPSKLILNPGESNRFSLKAYNSYNQELRIPFRVLWRATGGSMTYDGVYRAGGSPGKYTVSASSPNGGLRATANVIIRGRAGQIAYIKIWPTTIKLHSFEKKRFFVTAYSGSGDVIPAKVSWQATGGTISPNGIYQAKNTPGSYFIRASTSNGVSSTARVTVEHPRITSIEVFPKKATLMVGQTLQFKVNGYDNRHNAVLAHPLWSASGGIINSHGLYRADNFPGSYVLSVSVGKITASVPIVITPNLSDIVRIQIKPKDVQLIPGQQAKFYAQGYNKRGELVPVQVQWIARGGKIDANGVYTAGAVFGKYILEASYHGELFTKIWLAIRPKREYGPLSWIKITPKQIEINPGDRIKFQAEGRDAMGRAVPCQLSWMASGGTISSNGVYVAGNRAGSFFIQVSDSSSIKGSAKVIIIDSNHPVQKLMVRPVKVRLRPGQKCNFQAELKDENGQPLPTRITWQATGGQIDLSGNYMAGTKPGNYVVIATDENNATSVQVKVKIIGKKPGKNAAVYLIRWKMGAENDSYGRLEIKGRVFGKQGKRLDLIVEKEDGSEERVSQVYIRRSGQKFRFTGQYVRSSTRGIKIVLYDVHFNKLYEYRRDTP